MNKLVLFFVFFYSFGLNASVSLFEFDSVEDEKRFKILITELRCPTCQNQSLADSNSMVSDDLKQIVYEQIKAGRSDQDILAFMKQRYGEFILFKPEVSQSNWFLWIGPFIFLFVFMISFFVWYQHNKGDIEDE